MRSQWHFNPLPFPRGRGSCLRAARCWLPLPHFCLGSDGPTIAVPRTFRPHSNQNQMSPRAWLESRLIKLCYTVRSTELCHATRLLAEPFLWSPVTLCHPSWGWDSSLTTVFRKASSGIFERLYISRGSSQAKDRTQVSHISGRFFTSWAAREAQYKL